MLFHVTYRSYSNGSTWDLLSQNSTNSDRVTKCTIHKMMNEINEAYEY